MITEQKADIQLLQEALKTLTQRLGKDAWGEVTSSHERFYPYDGQVRIRLGETTVELSVEVKEKASSAHLGQLLQWKTTAPNLTLVSQYISPALGELLRQQSINYFDVAGNAYLRVEQGTTPVFVWLDGQKPIRTRQEEKTDHAFTKAGLQVTYWLLTHPGRVNDTVRAIAAETNVALETVVRTRKSLKNQGYLVSLSFETWGLTNRKKLLEKWVDAYTHRLKPRLLLGRFQPAKGTGHDDWTTWPITWPQTQWGGEPAADLLTGHLRPALLTLYSTQEKSDLMQQFRLLPAATGEEAPVTVYRKFWPGDEGGQTAPPLVVYADLLEQGSARSAEAAHLIYEQYLFRFVD